MADLGIRTTGLGTLEDELARGPQPEVGIRVETFSLGLKTKLEELVDAPRLLSDDDGRLSGSCSS